MQAHVMPWNLGNLRETLGNRNEAEFQLGDRQTHTQTDIRTCRAVSLSLHASKNVLIILTFFTVDQIVSIPSNNSQNMEILHHLLT